MFRPVPATMNPKIVALQEKFISGMSIVTKSPLFVQDTTEAEESGKPLAHFVTSLSVAQNLDNFVYTLIIINSSY